MTSITSSFDTRVDVKNKTNQIALVLEETKDKGHKVTGKDHVGGTNVVGDGEFRDLVGGQMNYDSKRGVNDAEALLKELLLGDGVSGVELVGLDGDSFTVAVSGAGGTTDYMVFEGVAAKEALANLDGGVLNPNDNNNNARQFSILDLNEDSGDILSILGDRAYDDFDLINNNIKEGKDNAGKVALEDTIAKLLKGEAIDGVEIIDVDANSIALSLTDGNNPSDTLIVTGIGDLLSNTESSIDALINNFKNTVNKRDDDFVILEDTNDSANLPEAGGTEGTSSDGFLFEKIEAEFQFNLGGGLNSGAGNNKLDDNNLLDALVTAGGEIGGVSGAGGIVDNDERLELVGVDSDSFTILYETQRGGDTYTDYLVFDYV